MGQSRTCPRERDDCCPLFNILADDRTSSLICVGYNNPEVREIKGDRFTHCWRNHDGSIDERSQWDRRDLLDTVSMMATALSIDENIRVGEGLTEDEMNERWFRTDEPPSEEPNA